ncbi:Enoyl-CoA hydratase/isomerase [Parvibaculum lavamentivorans DS-1]|uniref:Enoyl-CoA hydratase/isomerase n=1 Tax=Parvibaculum lavamentivorans (strain DS-1 / DSM 13023 / NCIMB 13966) TaxID=402881 RepID=A7HRV7_PARL1|nr:enoyl-CoA hydratase [Parvibaculum lavamentivorans]ABS62640.1 Enoyl-CoA hydratase/isomerase [Parvibaculum lavamentivorans DS-1]
MAAEGVEYEQVIYEMPAPKVARIVMNRPSRRNAQGITMTYELDDAFKRACHDEQINVIILAASGDHWNSGHDVSGEGPRNPSLEQVTGLWSDYGGKGWDGPYGREREIYLEITERWRNAPKPVIAEIQGSVISGGIILTWMCDLIVCSEEARFRDATAAEMGIPGVEFWQHPYEMSVRQAKEWLMTGGWMTAQEAERRGMVNHVVPRGQLTARTLELAETIAARNPFTMKLVKQAMNFAQDQMGRKATVDFAFHLHQIGHMQAMLTNGIPIDIDSMPPAMRATINKALAARETASAG